MKSLVLTPYSPLPANHGGKAEMYKHLEILRSLGECTIASAASRPVGMGWGTEVRNEIEGKGYRVVLREDSSSLRTWKQWFGLAYGSVCKGLGLTRAFGHTNPYHRFAFEPKWWYDLSLSADLAIVNYSFWVGLPTACPRVVVLHDIFSNTMWGGSRQEIEDLRTADLIVVISKDEEKQLRDHGFTNILWSPPLVKPATFDLTGEIGILGSANSFNREGVRWLSTVAPPEKLVINVYGALAKYVVWAQARQIFSYLETYQPYMECGIILLPTALGTGVQIKVVEALACGRAIVARRGAMRGLPAGEGAWFEVESAVDMWKEAERLSTNPSLRLEQGEKARAYYQRFLDHNKIIDELTDAYLKTSQKQ